MEHHTRFWAHFSATTITTFLLVPGVAAAAAVGFRFQARQLKKTKCSCDDWFILVSLAFYWCFITVGLHAAQQGLQVDKTLLSYEQLKLMIRLSLASYETCIFAITFARLSVIMLYFRMFSVSRIMTIGLKTIGLLSITWCVYLMFGTIFQCIPVQSLFEPDWPGRRCINAQTGFIITEALNCALDIVLVAMPIPIVVKLHLPRRDRVAIASMLLLGSFVSVTSILRIVYTYNPHTAHYDPMGYSQLWLSLQLCSAIICACLPTFRPLFRTIKRRGKVYGKVKDAELDVMPHPNRGGRYV